MNRKQVRGHVPPRWLGATNWDTTSRMAREYLMRRLCDCIRDPKFRKNMSQQGWDNIANALLWLHLPESRGRPALPRMERLEKAQAIERAYRERRASMSSSDAWQSLAREHHHASGAALARWVRKHLREKAERKSHD